jgi:EAL domain-containing protein (putative c-di-GMP-specific phosphodiesterase class I)
MELCTVAEYVECEETRKHITELGVDFAQGHVIGKPSSLRDLLADFGESKKTSNA